MVGKCLEWCSFHGTPKRCQIGATPKLSLQKAEAWKLKNRCGTGACGGGRTRARTWDPMIKSSKVALRRTFQMHDTLRQHSTSPLFYQSFSHSFALPRTQTFELLDPLRPFKNRF